MAKKLIDIDREFDDIILWRYLDLPKFIDFINNQEITISLADSFEDKNEGIPNDLISLLQNIKHYQEIDLGNARNPYDVSYTVSSSYRAIVHMENVKNNKYDELRELQKKVFITCWFGTFENTSYESLALWNSYSNKTGIALRINAKSFIEIFKSSNNFPFGLPGSIFFDKVQYEPFYKTSHFNDNEEDIDNFFRKDISYSFENEYRLIMDERENGNVPSVYKIKVNINDFEIIAHPLMPRWQFDNIKNLITEKFLVKNFIRSSLFIN